MKKEKQCCTLKQSKRLKILGIIQASLFYHDAEESISMFTCGELVQMNQDLDGFDYSKRFNVFQVRANGQCFSNFSDALAERLILSVKKKWLTVDEINKRLLEK